MTGGLDRHSPTGALVDLGERLRQVRQQKGISLREMARRVGVSASLISQIETNKAQPSVRTLYDIVTQLGISFDRLLLGQHEGRWIAVDSRQWGSEEEPAVLDSPPVQRAGDRRGLQFAQGVRWESLTPVSVPGIEFLYIEYQAGAESSPPHLPQRHPGREWGYVVSGTLHVSIGSH
ncbi:MAG: helix-turn-helix domain-containing protein, partial [Actinomycetota bacterium]